MPITPIDYNSPHIPQENSPQVPTPPILRQARIQALYQSHRNFMGSLHKAHAPLSFELHQLATQLKAMRRFPDATRTQNFTLAEFQKLKQNILAARNAIDTSDLLASIEESAALAFEDLLHSMVSKKLIVVRPLFGATVIMPAGSTPAALSAFEVPFQLQSRIQAIPPAYAQWEDMLDDMLKALASVPLPENEESRISTTGPTRLRVQRTA